MTKGATPPSARDTFGQKCALVVLGAAVRPDGTPSAVLIRRVERAVALMRAGTGDLLVPTGGVIAGRPAEAEVMAALAARMGVPADRILIESKARNTRENASFSLALLADAEAARRPGTVAGMIGQVVVVSDAWHLPRAVMLFRRAAPPAVTVRGCAVPVRAGHLGWWAAALREIPAFAVDALRGRGA